MDAGHMDAGYVDAGLLVAGYLIAVPLTARVLRIAWRRQLGQMIALEAATAMIVTGWALRGARLPAYMNAGFAIGFLATWVAVGRVRARREAPQGSAAPATPLDAA